MNRPLIVLPRAIDVGGRQAPMAQLRAACEATGFGRVRSFVAGGDLLLDHAAGPPVTARNWRSVAALRDLVEEPR